MFRVLKLINAGAISKMRFSKLREMLNEGEEDEEDEDEDEDEEPVNILCLS